MQVAYVIQLAVDAVQESRPAAKKVIIQSDNSSGFDSQEFIPFIFNMNTRLYDEKMLCRADGYSMKQIKGKHDWILTIHFSIKKLNRMWRMTMIYSLKIISGPVASNHGNL